MPVTTRCRDSRGERALGVTGLVLGMTQCMPRVSSSPRDLCRAARRAADDIDAALGVAAEFGPALPYPGRGQTWRRWELLAAAGAGDLTVARTLEPHADALAILSEAGVRPAPGLWGVFAAEASGTTLTAVEESGRWRLEGTKPWCSLARYLDHALVTAHARDGRRLFAVPLSEPSVTVEQDRWVARGLQHLTTGPVHFTGTPAVPVGAPQWYLDRPGFGWGGIGVAAVWFGGANAIRDRLIRTLTEQTPTDVSRMQLGAVDVAQYGAGASLRDGAVQIDGGSAESGAGALLAARIRAVVADAAERTLGTAGHALGPAPLAFDEEHARRVADLQLYLRQHHGERDLADIGATLLSA